MQCYSIVTSSSLSKPVCLQCSGACSEKNSLAQSGDERSIGVEGGGRERQGGRSVSRRYLSALSLPLRWMCVHGHSGPSDAPSAPCATNRRKVSKTLSSRHRPPRISLHCGCGCGCGEEGTYCAVAALLTTTSDLSPLLTYAPHCTLARVKEEKETIAFR
jgi:hypothetical protein